MNWKFWQKKPSEPLEPPEPLEIGAVYFLKTTDPFSEKIRAKLLAVRYGWAQYYYLLEGGLSSIKFTLKVETFRRAYRKEPQ